MPGGNAVCFQVFSGDFKHIASLCFKCFSYFICMFQVFHTDVIKVDQDAAHVVNSYTRLFQVYVLNVSSVPDECCKCFI
jgi:hypothetical protein